MDNSAEQLSASELGALLSCKTRKVDGACLECGRDMRGVTVRRAFCSPACRQKSWRRRDRARGPGDEMVYVTGHRIAPKPAGPDIADTQAAG